MGKLWVSYVKGTGKESYGKVMGKLCHGKVMIFLYLSARQPVSTATPPTLFVAPPVVAGSTCNSINPTLWPAQPATDPCKVDT